MKHLSDRQLTDLALALAPHGGHAHLDACPDCRSRLDSLRQVLALLADVPPPLPRPDFADRVWRQLQAPAPVPARRTWHAWAPATALATSLVLAAALGWALWLRPRPAPAVRLASRPAAAPSPLLLQAVGQHLDATQALLVEWAHAPAVAASSEAVDIAPEAAQARTLLAANRLYQQGAAASGDTAMAHLLATLEPVLLEIAHSPHRATPAGWRQMQRRIAASGILFQVRVVHQSLQSRLHAQEDNGTL